MITKYEPIRLEKCIRESVSRREPENNLTFAGVAQQYVENMRQEFAGANPEKQIQRLRHYLNSYCLPSLGNILMSDLETGHVVRALDPIWREKTPTAERVRITIHNVCEMARNDGVLRHGWNPARCLGNLEHFLASPAALHVERRPPTLDYHELPRFFNLLQTLNLISARALEFMILTAARPREVRFATWCEIDFVKRVWTIPGWKIKGRRRDQNHQVPLSDRAIEILKALPRDGGECIFPGSRGKEMMNQNALNLTAKKIHHADLKSGGPGFVDPESGRVATAHGMRNAFEAFAIEEARVEDHVLEAALSEFDRSLTRAFVKKVQLLSKRRELMNNYEKYVCSLVSATT
jgi:integrase